MECKQMHSGFVWHFCQSCLIFTTFLFECSHSKNKWFSKEQFEENSINIMSSFIWIDSQYLPLCFARQEILPRKSSEYRHDIHQCKLIINIKKQVDIANINPFLYINDQFASIIYWQIIYVLDYNVDLR